MKESSIFVGSLINDSREYSHQKAHAKYSLFIRMENKNINII